MSLLLSSAFILFAVIFRIIIQYYYTGDHGVRLAKSNSSFIEIISGTSFFITYIFSFGLIVFTYFDISAITPHPALSNNVIIAILGFTGISITVISQIQMGRSWRIGVDKNEKTCLITEGLYSSSRNPIYFGILLYWFAIVLSFPHPLIIISALVCWASIEIIVRKIEEPYLVSIHGNCFIDYFNKTNRYFILPKK